MNKNKSDRIGNYSKNKIVCSFYKVHSPYSAVIVDDVEDSWFKYVIFYKTKTGEVTEKYMIIEKDLDTWINAVKRSGFIVKI